MCSLRHVWRSHNVAPLLRGSYDLRRGWAAYPRWVKSVESMNNAQVNAVLAQSCQPFVAWRLEWVSGEVDLFWTNGMNLFGNLGRWRT